jgi:hypothetical protein
MIVSTIFLVLIITLIGKFVWDVQISKINKLYSGKQEEDSPLENNTVENQ